eukprot:753299-Pelagomonas_calceolata.AAC.3
MGRVREPEYTEETLPMERPLGAHCGSWAHGVHRGPWAHCDVVLGHGAHGVHRGTWSTLWFPANP